MIITTEHCHPAHGWRKRLLCLPVLCLLVGHSSLAQPASPFQKVKSVPEKYQLLPLGEIQPAGWLKEQIQQNLHGFTGHLDSLAPDLILDDDIYGKNRLSKKVKSKDVGALGVAGDWQVQFLWWNSETQSNWRDGYIRSAILSNDPQHLANVKQYVERILATQDADGYLGIYDPELRYRFDNENGELWAKASLLRGLLAWYEYSKDKKVLTAIERAAQNVMQYYPAYESHPFYSTNPNVGGVTHGLTITDVFENLYRITGRTAYLDYCLFLYADFSQQTLNEDAQYARLMKDSLPLMGHSVHTYEHLRSLAAAYQASGNQSLQQAITHFITKINWTTTASGAAIGDEFIGGTKANATNRGYEYCSLQELMHSYLSLFAKSGATDYAGRAEKIFLNAAQGARYPNGTAITYLKTDNSYCLAGGLNGDTADPHQTRYRYSPVHREAAVCCVPNAGRIAPYYVQHMWLKDNSSLVNALHGPSVVKTQLNGKWVTVTSDTQYPFGYAVTYIVTADQNAFQLKIRKPDGIKRFTVNEPYTEEDGFIVISKTWQGTQEVRLSFYPEILKQEDGNHETYFSYAGLVLALPIANTEASTKAYPVKGFYDLSHRPQHLVVYEYAGEPIIQVDGTLNFKTMLFHPMRQQKETVVLVPMAQTILRQVTFKRARPQ